MAGGNPNNPIDNASLAFSPSAGIMKQLFDFYFLWSHTLIPAISTRFDAISDRFAAYQAAEALDPPEGG